MKDAFGHHVWATVRLIDVCLELPSEQLDTAVPGRTARSSTRSVISWAPTPGTCSASRRDETVAHRRRPHGPRESSEAPWSGTGPLVPLLADELDPDAVIRRSIPRTAIEKEATVGIRFAQALHHGTDHRSQICTALTSLGMEPPPIDVWDFGVEHGRVVEVFPTS